ncbi:CzcE family metal-binding protein [Solimicrobium silvestre]|uniref:Heavy-metal resistance protein CzcE n=1 Tax=Solimicrobium silvestre TaxID=2099400 RepID=A0A2S9GZX7_9BURK|nr:CzcE family metal-binding protein [Solimicrobium silvestre]PRC93253.1 hypothetical protein S2091_1991 [Solimicrobium silvestre]
MKRKLLLMTMLAVVFLPACMTPMDLTKKISFWGDPASISFADRTIIIYQNTSYVNVTGGEIIKFIVGNKSFSWHFNGAGQYNFDLMLVAPQGMLDHRVMAYVESDPRFAGGR